MLTHNRVNVLCNNLMLLENNTKCRNEIIVVNNGSTDGTAEMVKDLFPNVILVDLPNNSGHCNRNHGFDVAKGEYLAVVDDDVSVFPAWDSVIFRQFEPTVAMIGPTGFVFESWNQPHRGRQVGPGEYADIITGYTFIMRSEPKVRFDSDFDPAWHEDSAVGFEWRLKGYRLKVSPNCCNHSSMAGPVDWPLHDEKVALLREKFHRTSIQFEQFDQEAYLQELERKEV